VVNNQLAAIVGVLVYCCWSSRSSGLASLTLGRIDDYCPVGRPREPDGSPAPSVRGASALRVRGGWRC